MLQLTHIPDVLQAPREAALVPMPPRRTILELFPAEFRPAGSIIQVNGRELTGRQVQRYRLREGDEVVLAMLPGGPAIGIPPLVVALSTLVITTAATFALAALLPRPTSPKRPGEQEDSPSVGFQGRQNTTGAGLPISIVYGEVRVAGHIVESFTDDFIEVKDLNDPNVNWIDPDDPVDEPAQTLTTRIVLCHGPIESVSGLEIDGNPVANIPGVGWEWVPGTKDQRPLQAFSETRIEQPVETLVEQATPVIEATDDDVDQFLVQALFFNGLFEIDDNGDRIEREVSIKVEYRLTSAGGAWTEFATFTAAGKTQGPKSVWFRSNILARDQYDVRVSRVTADNTDPAIQDEFRFELLTLVTAGVRAHPGLAQIGIQQVPQSLSTVPRVYSVMLKGKNDIRIYTDPETFTQGWTNNNAWCCADFITWSENGLGKFYTYDDIDLWSFVQWAAHCDELVPDGRGGFHKRCTFDYELNETIRGQEALELFTVGADALLVEEGGRWRVKLDVETPMSVIFNDGSFERDTLEYGYVARTERANRISANFLDGERNFIRNTMVREDDDALDLGEHYIEAGLNLFPVTRAAQVERELIKGLNRNRLQDRRVAFAAGLDGLGLRPGDVFGLGARATRNCVANGRLRRVAAGLLALELDEEVALDPATTYQITVQHALDGAVSTRTLVGVTADETSFVTVAHANWAREPLPGDKYILGAVEKYQVVRHDLGQDFRCNIEGVLYDDAIFDVVIPEIVEADEGGISGGTTAPQPDIVPGQVRNLAGTFREVKAEDIVNPGQFLAIIDAIDLGWLPPGDNSTVSHYKVYQKKVSSSRWNFIGETAATVFSATRGGLAGIRIGGGYNFAVTAVSVTGKARSIALSAQVTVS